ncbi:MAG: GMC oxidoreductase, partial [Pseudomonadota bacterium]
TRRGPLSLSINQGGGFVRTREDLQNPNLQLYFSPVSYTRAPAGKRAMMSPDPFPGFLLGYCTCRPTSEGWIEIASPNAQDAPAIQPNYLATEHDISEAIEAARFIRRLASAPAIAEMIERVIHPTDEATSDADLEAHIRGTGWTVFHPSCTARMGRDPKSSVVGPDLKVHGIEGLRVADASAFPNITSGNINAPVIMLAERAADIIQAGA